MRWDGGPGEEGGQFVEGERGWCRSEVGKVGYEAEELLGGVVAAQFLHAHGEVAFREALHPFVADERKMGVNGWCEAEQAVKVELLGCRKEQVGTSDYFCHSH